MVAKKESAEQKLLQMIEASGGGAPGGGGASGTASKKKEQKRKKKMGTLAVLSLCSKILIVLLIISVIFLVREINIGSSVLNKPVKVSVAKFENSTFDIKSVIPNLQDLKYYLSVISKRNIFKPYEAPKMVSHVEVPDNKNELEIARKVDRLKLVGVSWMDRVDTASVMIEDVDKNVTYFLQKGEKLNDIIIKTIYADSALLGYKDEEIIIKYEKSQK